MWTTEPARLVRMLMTLAAIAAITPLSPALGQDKPIEAWWLTATFQPTETKYEGLGATEIDPSFSKISMLSYESLPSEARDDVSWMRRDGFQFVAGNVFRRNRQADRVLTGVYEDNAGAKGRFVLILEQRPGQPWKVAYLHKQPGQAGFSVLVRRGNALYWGTCMQCDEFAQLRSSQGRYSLEGTP